MSGPDWSETARGMLASGMTLRETSRQLGRSPQAIRYALDINGEREKCAARRAKERELYRGARQRYGRSKAPDERRFLKTYRDQPEPAPLKRPTLAAVSSLSRPLGDWAAPKRTLPDAPELSAAEARIARIREIHLGMIRSGRIAEPGVIEEMVH